MSARPWLKWYPGDWRADPLLRSCEPVSRYVWMEMIGLMHEAEPYGHLVLAGRAMDYKTLSRVIGVDECDVKGAVKELESRGVFSRTNDGVIFCSSTRLVTCEFCISTGVTTCIDTAVFCRSSWRLSAVTVTVSMVAPSVDAS